MRGINRQAIFEEDDDFRKFMAVVRKCRKASGFELYGFCLLDNHAHLLLRAGKEGVSQAVKRISVSYVSWFNNKHERVGHLFQDRFGSEPIETDGYLLAALRYIHQNPVKAGLCRLPEHYEWSSYRDYMGEGPGLADIGFVKGLASDCSKDWRAWLAEFTVLECEDGFIDYDDKPPRGDSLLRKTIKDRFGLENAGNMSAWEREARDGAVRLLKEGGFGLRQISRVTGIPLGIVRSR